MDTYDVLKKCLDCHKIFNDKVNWIFWSLSVINLLVLRKFQENLCFIASRKRPNQHVFQTGTPPLVYEKSKASSCYWLLGGDHMKFELGTYVSLIIIQDLTNCFRIFPSTQTKSSRNGVSAPPRPRQKSLKKKQQKYKTLRIITWNF